MAKKFKLKVVLGEEACRKAEDTKATYGMLRELGDAKKETFDTEAERDAYIRGLEDASGWMEVYWEKM